MTQAQALLAMLPLISCIYNVSCHWDTYDWLLGLHYIVCTPFNVFFVAFHSPFDLPSPFPRVLERTFFHLSWILLSYSKSKSLLYGTLSIPMNVLCTLQRQRRRQQHPFPVFVCVVWSVFGLLCVDDRTIDFCLALALAFVSLMVTTSSNEQTAVLSSLCYGMIVFVLQTTTQPRTLVC